MLCVSTIACDHLLTVRARVPVPAPVTSDCLSSGMRATVEPDSVRFIEASLSVINQRLGAERSEEFARTLVGTVLRARSTCDLTRAPEARGVAIRSDDPPLEAWSIPATGGRTWLRVTGDSVRWFLHFPGGPRSYLLSVDTLTSDSDLDSPTWLTVDMLRLPKPGRGFKIATDCARGDSLHGHIIAVVPAKSPSPRRYATAAWQLDVSALRLREASPADVWCRTPAWQWGDLD